MAIDHGLRRLVLRTLLPAFGGHTAPDWARRLTAEGIGGWVIFGYNIAAPDQLRALTASLSAAHPDVLLSIDEEGGDVTRLAHVDGSPYPGNAALGAIDDAALTEQIYQAIGHDLADAGFNLNLAPSLDVNTVADNPTIGTRSFGADPARVAEQGAAAITGLQSAGVAACAKHFPGHGATHTDSHLELPTVDVPLSTLRERDLAPFAAAVKAGTKSVMTAHIRVPLLTGDLPATFSSRALVDLLRGENGYTGALLTDALEMQGAAGLAGGVPKAAAVALAAGNDLLCLGSRIDEELVEATVAEIIAAVGDGRLPLARLEDAAARVDVLANWAAVGRPTPGRLERTIGYPAARRAVQVDGSLAGLGTPLVVQVESESSIAAGPVPWGLAPHINGTEHLRVPATTPPDEVRRRAGTRPIVIVGRNLHLQPGVAELIADLVRTHTLIVVEMGWPVGWRPAGVHAFVTTYGASRANGWAAANTLGLAPALT